MAFTLQDAELIVQKVNRLPSSRSDLPLAGKEILVLGAIRRAEMAHNAALELVSALPGAKQDAIKLRKRLVAALRALDETTINLAADPDLADLPTDTARMQARYCVRSKDDLALGDDGLPYRVPLEETGYTESEAALAFAGECVRYGAALDVTLSFLVGAGWPVGGCRYRRSLPQ